MSGFGATDEIEVLELGHTLYFTFDDALRYAGPGSPGGVAVAFKAMQRAFALLTPDEPPDRLAVVVRTAFRGPGARDCFEAVTRAVTGDRYVVDRALLRPDRGHLLEDFVFEVSIGDRATTLLLRDGFVTAEFIDLARMPSRTRGQDHRFVELKADLAQRIMSVAANEVFEIS
jgi:hypothetical protein